MEDPAKKAANEALHLMKQKTNIVRKRSDIWLSPRLAEITFFTIAQNEVSEEFNLKLSIRGPVRRIWDS